MCFLGCFSCLGSVSHKWGFLSLRFHLPNRKDSATSMRLFYSVRWWPCSSTKYTSITWFTPIWSPCTISTFSVFLILYPPITIQKYSGRYRCRRIHIIPFWIINGILRILFRVPGSPFDWGKFSEEIHGQIFSKRSAYTLVSTQTSCFHLFLSGLFFSILALYFDYILASNGGKSRFFIFI